MSSLSFSHFQQQYLHQMHLALLRQCSMGTDGQPAYRMVQVSLPQARCNDRSHSHNPFLQHPRVCRPGHLRHKPVMEGLPKGSCRLALEPLHLHKVLLLRQAVVHLQASLRLQVLGLHQGRVGHLACHQDSSNRPTVERADVLLIRDYTLNRKACVVVSIILATSMVQCPDSDQSYHTS